MFWNVWSLAALIFCSCLVHSNFASSQDDYDEDYDEDLSNLNYTSNGSLTFTKELLNITKDSGKLARFICEVKNLDTNTSHPKISFTWRKNEAYIDSDTKIKIKTTKDKDNVFRSILKIPKLDFFDQGFYECIVTNGNNKISSMGFLNVNSDYNTVGSTVLNRLKVGEIGDNTDITTFVPNIINKNDEEVNLKPKTFTIATEFDLTATGGLKEEVHYNASEPFCQIYQGRRCRNYLQNQYVFVQPPYNQREIEDKLDKAFVVISQSNDISSSCNKFAKPSLCYSAFPICSDPKQINLYQSNHIKELRNGDKGKFGKIRSKLTHSLRRICRDDCLLLENELCSREYAIAKRHPVIGLVMELEECYNLPNETDKTSNQCLSLGVGDLNVNRDDKCFWDTGKLYRGVQDFSSTNKKCIRWSHQLHVPISLNPELTGHSYCRNPGNLEEEPFCYVSQNEREICGVNKCVYIIGSYVAISIGVAIIVIVIVMVCYCNKKKKVRNLQNKDLPTASKNIYGNPGPSSPIEMNTLLPQNMPPQRNSNKNSLQLVPQFTYKEVRFVEELGEGAFGKVYKGELKTKQGKIFVAVKSLKENASAKTQADFQREIELISELKHPNIICLLGVVVKQEPMCMLFEFMSEGDLHEFLIANSPGEGRCLSQDQFLHIAIQIAQGMEYLSGNHYVHRDLAARNCLVSRDLIVKISDFGLSRDMYSCDYYRVQSKSLLPVRWMPPESILYGKFTTESDVWSYGVVLWEIYSYGLQPYYGFNNQEVINMIRARKLLPCPEACPSYCYALMVECWAEQPLRRPNFSEIAHRLKVWKQSETANGAYFRSGSANPTPQRHGHSSKSSHTSDSTTVCPVMEQQNMTWDRSKPTSSRLHDSQNSLTSKCSSVGNNTQNTQSTSVSLENKSKRRKNDSLDRKNTVVNTTGDNFETKITL